MPLPEYPSAEADWLSQVNSNDFDAEANPTGMAAGGHRQNFPLASQYIAILALYCSLLGSYLDELAAQVETDAASAAAGSGTEATISNIWAALTAEYLSIRRIYAANVPVALTDASSIAWDMAAGINFKVTLGAAGRTLANPTNQVAGKSGFINVFQDATGGRTITTWGTHYKWIGDQPTWPTTPGARTKIAYFVNAVGDVELAFAGNAA